MDSNILLSNQDFIQVITKTATAPPSKPYCWILGTGASKQSGVPMGRELTTQWLTEMYNDPKLSSPKPLMKDWANKEFAHVQGFEFSRALNFYASVYQRRFQDNPTAGYEFLEKLTEGKEPSIGYSMLAQIMTSTPHHVAITTNFDNLLSLALVKYMGVLPVDCDHESLPHYVELDLKRPLLAKLHRDLLLAPTRQPDSIENLPKEWEKALTKVFERYTPIIVGFGDTGGSGGSLMRFLDKLAPIEHGVYWCYIEGGSNTLPDQEVQSLVRRHNGHVVPICGFNGLMLQMWEALRMTSLHEDLRTRHQDTHQTYFNKLSKLVEDMAKAGEITGNETMESCALSATKAAKRLVQDTTS